MSTQTIIERWMQDIQLEPSALNAAQRLCCFRVFGQMDVTLEWPEASEDLFIVIDLMDTRGGEIRRKRLEQAMKLNAYGLQTRGASIGWDEVTDRLVLSYRLALDRLDTPTLNSALINLVEIAQQVMPELQFEQEVAQFELATQGAAAWFKPIKA